METYHEGCPMADATQLTADVAAIKATVEGLPGAIESLRVTVTGMQVDAAKLPCAENQTKLTDLEKRTRRLEWFAAIIIGAVGLFYYALQRIESIMAALQRR